MSLASVKKGRSNENSIVFHLSDSGSLPVLFILTKGDFMKVLLALFLMSGFLNVSNADDSFDEMLVREIYARGYSLRATVVAQRGVVVEAGSRFVYLAYGGNTCRLKVRTAPSQDSLIRRGVTFNLPRLGIGFPEGRAPDGNYGRNALFTNSQHSKIIAVDFMMQNAHIYGTLKVVKERCPALSFEVLIANLPDY